MGCIQSTPKQVPAASKSHTAHAVGQPNALPAGSGDAWLQERTTLTVILPISNPISFRRRTQLFKETVQRILLTDQRLAKRSSLARVNVLAVELAFDDDDYVSTPTAQGFPADAQRFRDSSSPFCTGAYSTSDGSYEALQFRASRSDATLWNKSNLVNLGLRHLLHERRLSRDSVVAWVDADVEWQGDAWVKATLAEFCNPELLSAAHRTMNPPQWPLLVQMFETAALLVRRAIACVLPACAFMTHDFPFVLDACRFNRIRVRAAKSFAASLALAASTRRANRTRASATRRPIIGIPVLRGRARLAVRLICGFALNSVCLSSYS